MLSNNVKTILFKKKYKMNYLSLIILSIALRSVWAQGDGGEDEQTDPLSNQAYQVTKTKN